MQRDCDSKLESMAREYADKLATSTKEWTIRYDLLKRDSDLRQDVSSRDHAEKLAKLTSECHLKLATMSIETH